jgi:hypothetical protein
MPEPAKIRVPHDRERSEPSWGLSLPATAARCPIHRALVSRDEWAFAKRTALLLLTLAIPALKAQTAPCGLTSIKETAELVYPPIARVAHVNGLLIFLVTFNQDGTVANTRTISGNKMLEGAAMSYVQGWKANAYTGPRECPVVIGFRIITDQTVENSSEAHTRRADLQHVEISTGVVCLCDPGADIEKRRKRFLFF